MNWRLAASSCSRFSAARPTERASPQSRLREELAEILRRRRPGSAARQQPGDGKTVGARGRGLRLPSIAHLRDIVGLSAQAVADLNCHRRLLAVSQATREFHVARRPRRREDARALQRRRSRTSSALDRRRAICIANSACRRRPTDRHHRANRPAQGARRAASGRRADRRSVARPPIISSSASELGQGRIAAVRERAARCGSRTVDRPGSFPRTPQRRRRRC